VIEESSFDENYGLASKTTADERLTRQDELQTVVEIVQQYGEWIRNADTKAGLLSAVVSILLVGLTQNTSAIKLATSASDGRGRLALASLVLLVVSFGVAGFFLVRLQIPRLLAADQLNRFAFPSVARSAVEDLKGASARQLVEEAWEEAHTLARTAMRRFTELRLAWIWTAASLACFVIFCGISSTGTR
jgi:hypothetical protein